MPNYSVVICTLDRPDDLKRCFDSWLAQDPKPHEVIVVHGGRDDRLAETLRAWIGDSGVTLKYVRMAPSLVRQRNAGIDHAAGDVVFFVDDDAEYFAGYARAILDVYASDHEGRIGGVQGAIDDLEGPTVSRFGLSKIFMLPRLGDGRLQRSGWPAFYGGKDPVAEVEVFSGPSMSFRREVLRDFRFDEALAKYWVGDDYEMSYRISRKYTLQQVAAARLAHYVSPLGRDSARRYAKMAVVNHLYMIRRCFGMSPLSWLCWAWSELGAAIIACLWVAGGRGTGRLRGTIDGYRELCGFEPQAPVLKDSTSRGESL